MNRFAFHNGQEELIDTPLERFGRQIWLQRKKKGYNLYEFSSRAGIDPQTLMEIEYGLAPYDKVFLWLEAISGPLHVPLRALQGLLKGLYLDHI
jgi:transcriptional regulator with XRE-family HTH domain